jgi:hypothetical protein
LAIDYGDAWESQSHSLREPQHAGRNPRCYVIAVIIARIPDLMALGRAGQARATAKKSSSSAIGTEIGGDAFTPSVSEIAVFPPYLSGFVEGSTPFTRFKKAHPRWMGFFAGRRS